MGLHLRRGWGRPRPARTQRRCAGETVQERVGVPAPILGENVMVTGIGPILAMSAGEFVGPSPAEIQAYVIFVAGVAASAKDLAASRALLQFMTGPDAAAIFKTKDMERD